MATGRRIPRATGLAYDGSRGVKKRELLPFRQRRGADGLLANHSVDRTRLPKSFDVI
jgi:hypothetical protein